MRWLLPTQLSVPDGKALCPSSPRSKFEGTHPRRVVTIQFPRDCLQPVPSAQTLPASGPLCSVGPHLSALLRSGPAGPRLNVLGGSPARPAACRLWCLQPNRLQTCREQNSRAGTPASAQSGYFPVMLT